jgi:GDPmannose 4,6-dehydratase
MKKRALILGITGQDGSYLAELLLKKKYEVHGLVRRSATGNTKNIDHIISQITLHAGDLADTTSLYRIIKDVEPYELYNEADQDHAGWSFNAIDYSSDITGAAVGRILEVVRQVNPKIKVFQPLTSNMFGKTEICPQNEQTPLRPQSPYACAKVYAWMLARYYRDVYGMYVACGILYNHESPRRTNAYVTHKITEAAVKIVKGMQKKLILGDVDMPIDFGYAPEFVEGIWHIMQQKNRMILYWERVNCTPFVSLWRLHLAMLALTPIHTSNLIHPSTGLENRQSCKQMLVKQSVLLDLRQK